MPDAKKIEDSLRSYNISETLIKTILVSDFSVRWFSVCLCSEENYVKVII